MVVEVVLKAAMNSLLQLCLFARHCEPFLATNTLQVLKNKLLKLSVDQIERVRAVWREIA
jgi:hypothetical protein